MIPHSSETRQRRALLFMPGDDLHKIQKGAGLDLDCVIMDLEDGVALSHKETGRQITLQALQSLEFGRTEKLVRINPVGSGLELDDLKHTIDRQPDGVVLPKVEHADQIAQIDEWLTTTEQRHGWRRGQIRLLAMIESAVGVVNLKEIAAASPRLDALIFGAEDFASSIGATRTLASQEVFYARSALVLHAKAQHLQALDSIYVDIHNLDGLAEDARFAAQLGYDGKTAIHPKHIPVIVAAFTPTDAEAERAVALISAYEAFKTEGKGVFTFEGKMVDMPMVKAAQNVLARAGRA